MCRKFDLILLKNHLVKPPYLDMISMLKNIILNFGFDMYTQKRNSTYAC